ncbi:MAG: 30S ribosomal protein S20 [bacterium]|nr:30S ribosomal protein S20 [bacterium]
MPITKSAKKALRVSLKKKKFNLKRKEAMKDVVKKIKKLTKEGGNEEAVKMMPAAYKAIDKAAKRGVIKKNTANRKKSRLAKSLSSQK